MSKQKFENEGPLQGVNVVVGSTDVHEFGKEVIKMYSVKLGLRCLT